MSLFEQDTFEARLGHAVDVATFDQIHDYISALVVLEGGGPYTALSVDQLTVLAGVGISAALREYGNPQRHQSEGSGPFSFGGAIQTLFTTDELRVIGKCYGTPGYGRAYTVPLSTPVDTAYPYVGA